MRLRVERPLREKVQDGVLELIRKQRLKAGDQLPTESELSATFGVGRSTLREAVANLVSQGLLYRVQGRGTFVQRPPVVLNHDLADLKSVTELIRGIKEEPSTDRIQVKTIAAPDDLAHRLDLKPGDPCVRIERVRRAGTVIAAYCIDIVRKDVYDTCQGEIGESLFELFAAAGHPMAYTHTAIAPTVLTRRDLPEMSESVGLFLLLEEVFYDAAGMPICYSNDYYNTDVVRFDLIRRRRPDA